MTYRRILVPFDGSKYAKKALEHAVQIAQTNNGMIYLCTVVSIGSVVPPGSLLGLIKDASRKNIQKQILSSALVETQRMQSQQIEFCKSKGVLAYKKIIPDGNVPDEILGLAKRNLVDLIVIGSQGLHGIAKIKTLGSVSRKISEYSHCPVLIVR